MKTNAHEKEMKTYDHKNAFTRKVLAALFIIHSVWKCSKCPLISRLDKHNVHDRHFILLLLLLSLLLYLGQSRSNVSLHGLILFKGNACVIYEQNTNVLRTNIGIYFKCL